MRKFEARIAKFEERARPGAKPFCNVAVFEDGTRVYNWIGPDRRIISEGEYQALRETHQVILIQCPGEYQEANIDEIAEGEERRDTRSGDSQGDEAAPLGAAEQFEDECKETDEGDTAGERLLARIRARRNEMA